MYKSPIRNHKLLFEQLARPSRMAGPDMRKQVAKLDQEQPKKDGCPTGLPGDYFPPPIPNQSGGGWNINCAYEPEKSGCVYVNPPGAWYDPSYLEWWNSPERQAILRARCLGAGVQTESYNMQLNEQNDDSYPDLYRWNAGCGCWYRWIWNGQGYDFGGEYYTQPDCCGWTCMCDFPPGPRPDSPAPKARKDGGLNQLQAKTESYKKSPIRNTKLFEQLDPKLPYEIIPGPMGPYYWGPDDKPQRDPTGFPTLIPQPAPKPEPDPPEIPDEYCEHGCWSDKEGNLHYIRCDENGKCTEWIIPCGHYPAAECQGFPDFPNTPGPGGGM